MKRISIHLNGSRFTVHFYSQSHILIDHFFFRVVWITQCDFPRQLAFLFRFHDMNRFLYCVQCNHLYLTAKSFVRHTDTTSLTYRIGERAQNYKSVTKSYNQLTHLRSTQLRRISFSMLSVVCIRSVIQTVVRSFRQILDQSGNDNWNSCDYGSRNGTRLKPVG